VDVAIASRASVGKLWFDAPLVEAWVLMTTAVVEAELAFSFLRDHHFAA